MDYIADCITTIGRLLRRTLLRSILYCAFTNIIISAYADSGEIGCTIRNSVKHFDIKLLSKPNRESSYI